MNIHYENVMKAPDFIVSAIMDGLTVDRDMLYAHLAVRGERLDLDATSIDVTVKLRIEG